MRGAFYLLSFIGPLNTILAFWRQGVWSFFPLIFSFVLLPFLELVMPVDKNNFPPSEEAAIKNKIFYDLILWSNLPIQFALLFFYLSVMEHTPLSSLEQIGLTLSMGLSCGMLGINVAHELGHRNSPHEQFMARLLLMSSWYWHFIIEHNKGHHKNVATPQDPASARLNEPLYSFFCRSIWGGIRSAWKIQTQQALHQGYSVWSLKNEMILALLTQIVFTLGVGFFFGIFAMTGFLAAAFFGILLLETVNYIEHYGLTRKQDGPQRYGKVNPSHSWNADHIISRLFLFNLSRHSDHHYNAARKYQILRHHEQAPQLPTGYPGMMIIALIPPLWFRIMNKKLLS
jgi:alkane 1-monooxygenase